MTNIKEEIKELHFAACPTDTEEPFYWKWNEHGLTVLEAFFKSKFEEREKELVREIGQKFSNTFTSKESTHLDCVNAVLEFNKFIQNLINK